VLRVGRPTNCSLFRQVAHIRALGFVIHLQGSTNGRIRQLLRRIEGGVDGPGYRGDHFFDVNMSVWYNGTKERTPRLSRSPGHGQGGRRPDNASVTCPPGSVKWGGRCSCSVGYTLIALYEISEYSFA